MDQSSQRSSSVKMSRRTFESTSVQGATSGAAGQLHDLVRRHLHVALAPQALGETAAPPGALRLRTTIVSFLRSNYTSVPAPMPRASRSSFGMVTWPLSVTRM